MGWPRLGLFLVILSCSSIYFLFLYVSWKWQLKDNSQVWYLMISYLDRFCKISGRIGGCHSSCWIGGQGPQIWEYARFICLETNPTPLCRILTKLGVQHSLQYIILKTGFLVHLIGLTKLVYNLLMAFKIRGIPLHCSLHWKKSLGRRESTGRSSVMTC